MNCREFRQNISHYVDDVVVEPSVRDSSDAHLRACPLCRAELVDTRKLRRSLMAIRQPSTPPDLTDSIQRAVSTELVGRKAVKTPVFSRQRWENWLEFRLMPYSVGTLASILLFATMFTALQTAISAIRNLDEPQETAEIAQTATMVAANNPRRYDTGLPYSPADYAALRSPYTLESPSVNPKGALVSFTSSLMRGEVDETAVVVVADVFGNGLARVADVLEAPHDQKKLDELERILSNEPAFVPASYDKRPENMRVVLMIQRVNVSGETGKKENPKSRKF